MDKQRKIMIAILIIGVPLFIWIQFFEVPNKVKLGEAKLQQDPVTHVFENVTKYRSLYMGDASNLSHLMAELPLNEHVALIELDPDDLAVIVDYDVNSMEIEEKAKQTVIYNTTAAFALIENLEQVNMQFKDEMYTVSRDRVERWFGTTLVDFKDPKVFEEKVQQKLTEDISPWFLAYTEKE